MAERFAGGQGTFRSSGRILFGAAPSLIPGSSNTCAIQHVFGTNPALTLTFLTLYLRIGRHRRIPS